MFYVSSSCSSLPLPLALALAFPFPFPFPFHFSSLIFLLPFLSPLSCLPLLPLLSYDGRWDVDGDGTSILSVGLRIIQNNGLNKFERILGNFLRIRELNNRKF